jgi:hypothetical protein
MLGFFRNLLSRFCRPRSFRPLVSQNLIGRLDFYFEGCTTVSRYLAEHFDIMEKRECDQLLVPPEVAGIGIWGYPTRISASYDEKNDSLTVWSKKIKEPTRKIPRLQNRLIFHVTIGEKQEVVGITVNDFKKFKHSKDIPLPK